MLIAQAVPPVSAQEPWPLTAPERTDHLETTRYDDVVTFMREVAARSPLIQLDTFGYTF